jgi:hypothetical protein
MVESGHISDPSEWRIFRDVLALAYDTKTCLLQRTLGIEVVDSGDLRQCYTAISISRTSWPRVSSSTA